MDITNLNREWFGMQTIENTPAIAERLTRLLADKKYTFVAQNYGFRESGSLEVRTDQRLESETTVNYLEDKEQNPPRFAGLGASDTYGVWGTSTFTHEETYDPNFNNPYWVIGRNQAKVVHRAPAGHILVWIIALQNKDN